MAALVNSLFALQASALHVAGSNSTVTWFAAAQIACLMIVGWLAIPLFGVGGVSVAELAAIAAYLILHHRMVRTYGPSRMYLTYVLGASGAVALFWPTLGGVSFLPLACVLISPPSLRIARQELPRLLFWRREREASGPVVALCEDRGGERP